MSCGPLYGAGARLFVPAAQPGTYCSGLSTDQGRPQVRTLAGCHRRSTGESEFHPPLTDHLCCVQVCVGLVPTGSAYEHRLAHTAFLVDVVAVATGDRRARCWYDYVQVPVAGLLLTRPMLQCVPALVQNRPVESSLLVDVPPRRFHLPLTGLWSARRGAYRIVYELNEAELVVDVIRIDHRADVYRPR